MRRADKPPARRGASARCVSLSELRERRFTVGIPAVPKRNRKVPPEPPSGPRQFSANTGHFDVPFCTASSPGKTATETTVHRKCGAELCQVIVHESNWDWSPHPKRFYKADRPAVQQGNRAYTTLLKVLSAKLPQQRNPNSLAASVIVDSWQTFDCDSLTKLPLCGSLNRIPYLSPTPIWLNSRMCDCLWHTALVPKVYQKRLERFRSCRSSNVINAAARPCRLPRAKQPIGLVAGALAALVYWAAVILSGRSRHRIGRPS